jgi:Ca-activated chloride channel homolog
MRFANFKYITGFWFIFLLMLFYIRAYIHKKRLLQAFFDEKNAPNLISEVNFKRQKIKMAILVLGLSLSILVLMQPQWGYKWQETKQAGIDILFAVDVSKSMLAEDIKPNRFTRSKLAVKDFVHSKHGDRVGLIAFAGSAYLQCPFTNDYSGFMLALDSLSTDTIPRGGTSISSAIKEAISAYDVLDINDKILILITDGEDHEEEALFYAKQAKEKGINIFCIGIGSSEGELIPIMDADGRKTFLRDNEGNVVKSRLNEDLLKQIAFIANGIYVRASGTEFGLDHIYKTRLSALQKTETKEKMKRVYYERFQFPLFAAFLLFIIEALISDKKPS